MLLVCCACGCDCSTLCACYLDGNAHDKRMVSSIGDNVDGFVLGNCTIAEDALAAIPRKMQVSSEPAECLGMWTQDPGPSGPHTPCGHRRRQPCATMVVLPGSWPDLRPRTYGRPSYTLRASSGGLSSLTRWISWSWRLAWRVGGLVR